MKPLALLIATLASLPAYATGAGGRSTALQEQGEAAPAEERVDPLAVAEDQGSLSKAPEPADGGRRPEALAKPAAPEPRAQVSPVPGAPIAAEKPRFEFRGFFAPAYYATYSPRSHPAERWGYGWSTSSAGLNLTGEPLKALSFDVLLLLDVDLILTAPRDASTWLDRLVDTAAITYEPIEQLNLKAGLFRVPWSLSNRFANSDALFMTNLMFPACAMESGCPQRASSWGVAASGELFGKSILTTAGVFDERNGPGLFSARSDLDMEGPVFAGRIDLHPLGEFSFAEDDRERGPLRLGAGAGMRYHAASHEGLDSQDLRISGALRAAFKGLYAQAEYLRYQRQDSFSDQSRNAEGTSVQASYYVLVTPSLSIKPMARVSYTWRNEMPHDLKEFLQLEGGLAFYPRIVRWDPDSLRAVLQYAWQHFDDVTNHGVQTSIQFTW